MEVVGASPPTTAPDGVGTGVVTEKQVERLVALGRALSDPIRVRMLGMMAGGRGCCDLPNCGVPAEDQDAGICVCEFEQYFGMGQSKVSYPPPQAQGCRTRPGRETWQMELLLPRWGGRPRSAR